MPFTFARLKIPDVVPIEANAFEMPDAFSSKPSSDLTSGKGKSLTASSRATLALLLRRTARPPVSPTGWRMA
jgi:hypothetical protein